MRDREGKERRRGGGRGTYFKELARVIVGSNKSGLHRDGHLARNSGKISLLYSLGTEFLLL